MLEIQVLEEFVLVFDKGFIFLTGVRVSLEEDKVYQLPIYSEHTAPLHI